MPDADALDVGLAGGADEGERGHRRAEHAHQEQERSDRTARDKVVAAGRAQESLAQHAEDEQETEIHGDDEQGRGALGALEEHHHHSSAQRSR